MLRRSSFEIMIDRAKLHPHMITDIVMTSLIYIYIYIYIYSCIYIPVSFVKFALLSITEIIRKKKMYKKTNNDLQNTHIKLNIK